jgi:hypothetical protein
VYSAVRIFGHRNVQFRIMVCLVDCLDDFDARQSKKFRHVTHRGDELL